MVLVDTTVWIDFLRGRDAAHVAALERLLDDERDVCICGIILTEVLQGIREDKACKRTSTMLDALLYLPMSKPTFIQAAALYRSLRQIGVTIRKPVDCMIAAVAMEHGAILLHNDRDFDALAQHTDLRAMRR